MPHRAQRRAVEEPSYRRRASHAGSWYSDDGNFLGQQLAGWLEATPKSVAGTVRAVIAPHAGFSYSAETAAFAYSHIDPARVSRVFVLGPSHHVHMRGCAVSTACNAETPIGNITIDEEITQELLATGQFEVMTRRMDEDEHSIEMHLPFIKKVMQQRIFKVVTIMVGALSAQREAEYGRLFARYLDDPSNFFVISSDFCHWGSRFRYQPQDPAHGSVHQYIRWLDHQGMSLIQAQDVLGFHHYLEQYRNTICGRHPIATFMNTLKASSLEFDVAWVKYEQSSQATSIQHTLSGLVLESGRTSWKASSMDFQGAVWVRTGSRKDMKYIPQQGRVVFGRAAAATPVHRCNRPLISGTRRAARNHVEPYHPVWRTSHVRPTNRGKS